MVPTNPTIFSAAYAGAMAGMTASGRWISTPPSAPGSLPALATIALAFAESFDQAWNRTDAPSSNEVLGIRGIVQSSFQNRQPMIDRASNDVAGWRPLAEVLTSAVRTSEDLLTAEAIPSPPWPTPSSGGLMVAAGGATGANREIPAGSTNSLLDTGPLLLTSTEPNQRLLVWAFADVGRLIDTNPYYSQGTLSITVNDAPSVIYPITVTSAFGFVGTQMIGFTSTQILPVAQPWAVDLVGGITFSLSVTAIGATLIAQIVP